MLTRSDLVKWTVLQAVAGDRQQAGLAMADFDEEDWSRLNLHAAQHRLRPLLYCSQSHPSPIWQIPPAIRDEWHKSYQRSARRYLQHLSAMTEISAVLSHNGHHHAFLKGSTLTTGLYPDPAMRPLRDLDILIAPEEAQAAAATLRHELGFKPRPPQPGLVPEDYALHKHLAPLHCPRRNVTVELHRRLADHGTTATDGDILLDPERLLQATRNVQMSGIAVPMLDWPETLLHLITHAVLDHRLNVGPLVLCDVTMVLRRSGANLQRFWTLAQESQRGPAVQLVFAMLERLAAPESVIFPSNILNGGPHPKVVEAALLTLLQDTRKSLGFGSWARILAIPSFIQAVPTAAQRFFDLRRTARLSGAGKADARLSLWQRTKAMTAELATPQHRQALRRSRLISNWLNRR